MVISAIAQKQTSQGLICAPTNPQRRTMSKPWTCYQSTPYNHHHHSSFFLKKNMVFRKNGLQGHGALVFDFKICPFWVNEGGQPRSMQGGTKADNSFPANIQKAVLCFPESQIQIIKPRSQNQTPWIHHPNYGIQIRWPKSGNPIQTISSTSWNPNQEFQVQRSKSRFWIPEPWNSNPVVQIQLMKSMPWT